MLVSELNKKHKWSTDAYQLPVDEVIDRLRADLRRGLSEKEAAERLRQYGENVLERRRRKPWWQLLGEQFLSPLVWVLLSAGVLAYFFGDWLEGTAILVVILINAVIGFVMEWQADRSMEALRKLSQSHARVFRDGRLHSIGTAHIVPGDLVFLEAGDVVPADGRIVSQERLEINESALTGESIPVTKQVDSLEEEADLHDRRNMAYKGTTVSRGNGRAVIVATGAATELGAIARLVASAEKEVTPLERKLGRLSQRLLWITLALALIIFLIGLVEGRELYAMIKTAVALAVAAIPEGLPIVATIALARGMLRLARFKVIVKKLSAVETLGQTQVIFTDKTGTLTENHLSVDTLLFPFAEATVEIAGRHLSLNPGELRDHLLFHHLCRVGVLCNNAALHADGEVGDPLEVALLRLAAAAGQSPEEVRRKFPRLQEMPFDSNSMMMGTLHQEEGGKYLACVKGAVEVVLAEVDHILDRDGNLLPMTDPGWWTQQAEELAARGLRTLAMAYAEMNSPKDDPFQHLVLIGVVGFLDPPREEVREAMQHCREAGVQVIMVTGDHPATARNIAYRTGLTPREDTPVMMGKQLTEDAFDDPQLTETRIFARVSPVQKLRLIQLYQERGYIVGMTGDGINDTPALKKADIGIAMGRRGTEAAKEVADLVLEDDAFTSIVVAIRQGRGIFDNIRHFVVYLLSCNLSELLVVAIAFLASMGTPLTPLQILFLNMVTDVFPALALGMNRAAPDVMRRPPRKSGESILNRQSWREIALYSAGLTLSSMGILFFGKYQLQTTAAETNNLVFFTLILAQLWHVFNLPTRFWRSEVMRNSYIWAALAICLVITVIVYAIPLTRTVLGLQHLDLNLLEWILAFSLLPVVLVQIVKKLNWV